MNSVCQIDKLEDGNYESWRIQMRSILIHSGQWRIVNGDTKIDADKRDSETEKLKLEDEKALATIFLNIKPSQLNSIKNCSTSREAWLKLQNIHKPQGPMQKVGLYKRLLNLSMKDNSNMSQHLNEFVEISEKLTEVGIDIQEELLTIILLTSLPKQFDNFVVAIETRDNLPSFSSLRQKLLEEAERRGQVEKDELPEQQVFAAKTHRRREKSDEAPGNGSRSYGKTEKKKQFKGKCFSCGQFGHYANKCEANHGKKKHQSFTMIAVAEAGKLNRTKWYLDSGATAHMCNDKNLFVTFEEHDERIILAGDNFLKATGRGNVLLKSEEFEITLQNVLYSQDIQANFISISKAVNQGLEAIFTKSNAIIRTKQNDVILKASKVDDMFVLENRQENVFIMTENVWHNRFGHLNHRSLKDLSSKGMVVGMNIDRETNDLKCKSCMIGKVHTLPFPKQSETCAKDILDVVHSDVCGPINVPSVGGSKYFLTFIDDRSRRIFIYFMKSKDEVFDKFKEFQKLVERQTGKKIKILRSDNGGEYINAEFNKYLKESGIARQLSVPHSPQQNGVAERANRTLVEMARTMMLHAGVKDNLWAEAIMTAAYLRNRCPTKHLDDKTPYEIWHGRKPNVSHFRTFGSYCVALNKSHKRKFEKRGQDYIMVGYSLVSKAYRLYDKEQRKVIERRDVIFDENRLQQEEDQKPNNDCFTLYLSQNKPQQDVENIQEESVDQQASEDGGSQPISGNIESGSGDEDCFGTADENSGSDNQVEVARKGPGRPKIVRTGKPGRPRKVYNVLNRISTENVPQTVKEALESSNSKEWQEAMVAEFTALEKNQTWDMVDLPPKSKAIGCKWVFALKRNKRGEIERYKARLVAKGCSQRYGFDYKETFSPVVRYATIRMLLAIAVQERMHLHQIDVSTAYLNSELNEDVYMKPPEGFNETHGKVLKLRKAIYGLKQSGRAWNEKLDTVLQNFGFVPCNNEPCLYKMKINGELILVAVYVDDIIIACKDEKEIFRIKSMIAEQFDISDKGRLQHFLGMEIEREGDTGTIKLSQTQYIKDMLEQYGMSECKSSAVPLTPNYQVKCIENCKKANQHEYQSIIGALTYLAITTRPDILHTVNKLAQRNTDPHVEHLVAVKNILRYLAGTANYKLTFKAGQKDVFGYADADWASCTTDRKSYTGYIFFINGCAVSWESRKQNAVALSSTEAEYMAMSNAAKEAIYLRRLLTEIEYSNGDPVLLNVDNQGAYKLAQNPVFHNRTKHVDIKFHHVREVVRNKEIELKYCPTNEMVADILTKNLCKTKHVNFANLIGLS